MIILEENLANFDYSDFEKKIIYLKFIKDKFLF